MSGLCKVRKETVTSAKGHLSLLLRQNGVDKSVHVPYWVDTPKTRGWSEGSRRLCTSERTS